MTASLHASLTQGTPESLDLQAPFSHPEGQTRSVCVPVSISHTSNVVASLHTCWVHFTGSPLQAPFSHPEGQTFSVCVPALVSHTSNVVASLHVFFVFSCFCIAGEQSRIGNARISCAFRWGDDGCLEAFAFVASIGTFFESRFARRGIATI